jgi:hypothetical protein
MHFKQAYDPFRALGSAWEVIKKAPAAMLVGGALLWITDIGQVAGLHFDYDPSEANTWQEVANELGQALLASLATVVVLIACCFGIIVWAFRGLLLVGFGKCVERALRREPESLAELFTGYGQWAQMLLVRVFRFLLVGASVTPLVLVVAIPLLIGAATDAPKPGVVLVMVLCAVAYLPVILYVALGLSLAPCAVAIEGMSATEAISRSWTLVRGHRLQLFLYYLVLAILEVVCCCTLFLATTFTAVAYFESYVQLVRERELAPPPPPPPPAPATDPPPVAI